MRDELIKMERYQKQFRFLYDNNIETAEQLSEFQNKREAKIDDLVEQRKEIYKETEENDEQSKKRIYEINETLKKYRADIRMCKAIFESAEQVGAKYKQAQILHEQAHREDLKHEHKRRSR